MLQGPGGWLSWNRRPLAERVLVVVVGVLTLVVVIMALVLGVKDSTIDTLRAAGTVQFYVCGILIFLVAP